MNWFTRSSLEIHPAERIIYLSPLGRADGQGATVEGFVTLTLSKATYIREVVVRLVATATVRSESRESTGILLDLKSSQSVEAKLDANSWDFAYTFTIDAASAHSARPSAGHGSLIYKLHATVTTSSMLGSYTAPELPITVVTMHGRPEEGAPPLDMHVEDHQGSIGPFSLTWRAPLFTQACIFQTEINFASPITELKLLNASLVLTEHIDFRHFHKGELEADTIRQTKETEISRLDEHQMKQTTAWSNEKLVDELAFPLVVEAGRPLRLRHLARMPISIAHHSRLVPNCRYSTPEGSETPIAISHALAFKLNFVSDGKMKQLTVRRPVKISSCLLTPNTALPPEYTTNDLVQVNSRAAESMNPLAPDWGAREVEKCCCNLSFEQSLQEFLRLEPEAPKRPHNAKDN